MAQSTPALTKEVLMNAEYTYAMVSSSEQKTIKLTNGVYEEDLALDSASKLQIKMADIYATGDLNGDKVADAVVVLIENSGGTGVFHTLVAVLNEGGKPVSVAEAPLGDRIQLKSLEIKNGEVVLSMVTQGPGDPACCPTKTVTQIYKFDGKRFTLPLPKPTIDLSQVQVSFDYQPLAKTVQSTIKPAIPFNPSAPSEGNGESAAIRFSFDTDTLAQGALPGINPRQRQLLVYAIEDYQAVFGDTAPAFDVKQGIATLQTLLKTRPLTLEQDIPVLPVLSGNQDLKAQVKYLDFKGGAGVRFVTRYSADTRPFVNEEIFYTFQGLTSDGKFFVALFYPVSASVLPNTQKDTNIATDQDAFIQKYDAYRQQTTQQLDKLKAADYQPSLDALDTLVKSLRVQ
jgi:hypothetical protein